ncbi:MAG TPA: hypothetical protein VME46_09220, partial [Acidimicrobiales bacterium]|nr:hypothetical protein [Acidimicrobiales bacterium]
MRIAVVGGIFGKPPEYRAVHQTSPETLLADGLEAQGHEVSRYGHFDRPRLSTFDIVHVHHLSYGAAWAALDRGTAPLVFTPHRADVPAGLRGRTFRAVAARADALVA